MWFLHNAIQTLRASSLQQNLYYMNQSTMPSDCNGCVKGRFKKDLLNNCSMGLCMPKSHHRHLSCFLSAASQTLKLSDSNRHVFPRHWDKGLGKSADGVCWLLDVLSICYVFSVLWYVTIQPCPCKWEWKEKKVQITSRSCLLPWCFDSVGLAGYSEGSIGSLLV